MRTAILLFLFLSALSFAHSASAQKHYDLEATGDHSVWVIVNEIRDSFEKDTGITLDLIPELAIVGKGCAKGFNHAGKGNPGRDFGLVCCTFTREYLAKRGMKIYPVAYEPMAVIVNKDNAVKNLTLKQARDIFAGRIAKWKKVGGADEKIAVITQLHCKDYKANWMGLLDGPEKFAKKRLDVKTQPDMAKTVAEFRTAIGHLEMTSVVEFGKSRLRVLEIDGVEPSSENMRRGAYPFYATLSVVTKGPAEGHVRHFIEYMRESQKVKQIMKKYGMIQAE